MSPSKPLGVLLGLAIFLGFPGSAACESSPATTASPQPFLADSLALEASLQVHDFATAEVQARRWLASAEALGVPGEIATAAELLSETLRLSGRADAAEAWTLAHRSLALRTEIGGLDGLERAASLNHIGRLYYSLAELDSAAAYWNAGLRIHQARLEDRSPIIGADLNRLAGVAFRQERFDLACSLYTEAIFRLEPAYGVQDMRVVTAQSSLGHALSAAGRPREARLAFQRVIPKFEESLGPDNPTTLDAYAAMGFVSLELARYAEADSLFAFFLAAKSTETRFSESYVVQIVAGQALSLYQLGNLAEAESVLLDALELCRAARSQNHFALGSLLFNLGRLEHSRGELARAERTLRESIREYEMNREVGSHMCRATLELGRTLRSQERLDEARAAFALADSLYEVSPGAGSTTHLEVRVELAQLEVGDEARHRALHSAEQLLSRLEERFSDDSPQVAGARLQLARLVEADQGPNAARPLYEQAVEELARVQRADAPGLALARVSLAGVLCAQGETDRAFSLALLAEQALREQTRRTLSLLSSQRSLDAARRQAIAEDALLSALALNPTVPRIAEAWDAIVHSRALVLGELSHRRHILGLVDETRVRELAASWVQDVERVATLSLAPSDEASEAGLRGAQEDLDASEAALFAASPALQARSTWDAVGLPEVSSNLPEGHALIAFVRWSDVVSEEARYGAFVLGRTGDPSFLNLGRAEEIDGLVDRLRHEVSQAPMSALDETRFRELALALRIQIWDPMESDIGPAKTVLIVPEGSLALVPWGALPDGETAYLVEGDRSLHLLSTERDVALLADAAQGGKGLFCLGDPDFDHDPVASDDASSQWGQLMRGQVSCPQLRDVTWGRIPETGVEVREITRRWSTATQEAWVDAIGSRATKDVLRREAPGNRVLHLATHGFVLDDCGVGDPTVRGFGGLVDGSESRSSSSTPQVAGLVLAGANLAHDSLAGILTASEVTTLNLQGVEWAVLSACGTAMGEVRLGEGVLSLGRAFRIAGARTVIMSLWSLEDASAREWVGALYRARLEAGASTEDAVRLASVGVLERRRQDQHSTHPFYWAGFIASGDWR